MTLGNTCPNTKQSKAKRPAGTPCTKTRAGNFFNKFTEFLIGYDSQLARSTTLSNSRGASCTSTRALTLTNDKGTPSALRARLFYRLYKGLGHLVNNNTSEATN